MDKKVLELTKLLWDYHHVNHALKKADCILGLGSIDPEVARYSSKLYLDGWAPRLAFSGGIAHHGDLLETSWDKAESLVFADIAIGMGVPQDEILLETQAQNTAENFRFTEEVFKAHRIDPKTVIVVQKPYMERRALATVEKEWPRRNIIVVSEPISFEAYLARESDVERLINIIVGDTERIKLYGERGYQTMQHIPENVWHAFEQLVARGYTRHLIA